MIDENNDKISGVFNRWSKQYLLDKGVSYDYKISREEYLEAAVSAPLANGMVLCLTRKSLESSLPFPKCDGAHDAWLVFFAVCNDKCWFSPEILAGYRLHGNNTCGNRLYKGNKVEQLRKKYRKLKIGGVRNSLDLFLLGQDMLKAIEKNEYTNSNAYKTAERVYEIGRKELAAVTSGRISGAFQLYRLFKTDIRYRSIGKAPFMYQLLRILIYSKKRRRSMLPEITGEYRQQ